MDGSVSTKIRARSAPRMAGILGRRGAVRASGCGMRGNRMGNREVATPFVAEGVAPFWGLLVLQTDTENGSTMDAPRRRIAYANMVRSPRTNILRF